MVVRGSLTLMVALAVIAGVEIFVLLDSHHFPAPRQGRKPVMTEKATFGAGCFWGVEDAFRHRPGVVETTVGYAGGTYHNPTYPDVCAGHTGHTEVVQVEYDPTQVTYAQLLDIFWQEHDPTRHSKTQYRSVIFTHTPAQQSTAEAAKAHLAQSGKYKTPIQTEILPLTTFYPAEEYHQHYYEKQGGHGFCGL
ncbi:MAG: peptide-methionine (S)-S-oxide reductase MsrA [Armatimonadota bacterium]